MKITEVLSPSKEAIFEAFKQDPNHEFSDNTLKEISENVANAKFSSKPMTTEEFNEWLDGI